MGRRFLISPKDMFDVSVEAENINPDSFSERTLSEIIKLPVYEGNRRCTIGDLFDVREEATGEEGISLVLRGDFKKVSRIGEGMSMGTIVIEGDCGNFVGFGMRGGSIVVRGSAGKWLGAEMRGGTIEVHGDAGDYVGALTRGLRRNRAMRGGMIIIHGNAGAEVGAYMVKGTIMIDGDCSFLPGLKMSGGTVLIGGSCGGKAGARMSGGKIVVCGNVGGVLPSFYVDSIVPSVKVKGRKIQGPFYLFLGDVLENISCAGRLYVSVDKNPELEAYKELIGSGEV